MTSWWPCCCDPPTCFKPCECFLNDCELHITSEGWTDNGSTDCSGIADAVFNRTHILKLANLTTGTDGFTCEFAVGYNDLVLTKNVGGSCICESQPVDPAYTVVGLLGCQSRSPTSFELSLTLYFTVHVYDYDAGCSPEPCTVEAIQEQWIAPVVLGGQSPGGDNPICDIGVSGPHSFTIEPTAGTSCGLGLDGSDATFTVEWKFCKPTNADCATCCNEVAGDIPNEVQAVISGIADGTVGSPEYECEDCSGFNGTYLLERLSGQCVWVYQFDEHPCTGAPLVDTILLMKLSINGGGNCGSSGSPGDCNWFLEIVEIDPFDPTREINTYGYFCDDGVGYGLGNKCSGWSSTVLSDCGDGSCSASCDYSSATATITAI